MTNALFDINGDGNDQGFTGSNGQAVAFKLRDDPAPGVTSVLYQVFDPGLFDAGLGIAANPPRSSCDAPTIVLDNGAGSTGQAVKTTAPTGTVTSAFPASGAHSYIVRCVVNGGQSVGPNGKLGPDARLIHERIIAVPNPLGTRKPITTETNQFEDDGWGQVMCDLVDNEGAQQVDWKDSVRAATAAALPAYTRVGNVITAAVNGAQPNVDTVNLNVGDSFLDKDNANQVDQGPYILDVKGDGSNPWSATRRQDFDSDFEVTSRARIPVSEGAVNGGKDFVLTNVDPITINTTALVFIDASGGGGVLTVADLTELKALDVSTLAESALIETVSLLDQFIVVVSASLLALADGITLVAPTAPSGDKVYVRRNLGNQKWRRQAAWFIDPSGGDDEATGLALGTALKTFSEIRRRVGPNPDIRQNVAIDVATASGGPLVAGDKIYIDWNFPDGHKVTFGSNLAPVASGTLTSATNRNIDTKFPQFIADTGATNPGAFPGRAILIAGGADITWIAEVGPGGVNEAVIGSVGGTVLAGSEDYDIFEPPLMGISLLAATGTANELVRFEGFRLQIDAAALAAHSTVGLLACRILSGSRLSGRALLSLESCLVDDGVFWEGIDAQFQQVVLNGVQRLSGGCSFKLDGENDAFNTINERPQTDSGIGTVDNHLGNRIIIREAGDLFIHRADGGSVRSCSFFVNEQDVLIVAGKLKGPNILAVSDPEVGMAIYGKVYETATGDIDLTGTDTDLRLGVLDRAWADGFFSDLTYGAHYRAFDESV